MISSVSFFVPGIPRPGGSKTAAVIRRKGGEIVMHNGRPLTTTREAGKYTATWRADVREAARRAMDGASPFTGHLALRVSFFFPRPKQHFRASGALKDNAPSFKGSRPDTTKLLRSLEDALTGLVWMDDSQIVCQVATKRYDSTPGARVCVQPADRSTPPDADAPRGGIVL